MSTAASLYEPDPPFDAYNFERWNQRHARYYPEYQREEGEDEVPVYAWLQQAVYEMRQRLMISPALKPHFPFRSVPRTPITRAPESSPVSAQPVTLSDLAPLHENLSYRILMIQAIDLIKEANKRAEGQPWGSVEQYVRDGQDALRDMERQHSTALDKRVMRVVKKQRDKFWNSGK